MKLLALICKNNYNDYFKIILNFYSKLDELRGCDRWNINAEFKIEKILNFKDFFSKIYFSSVDSSSLDTPCAIDVNRIVEPLLNEALSRMTSQQRYEFSEYILFSVSDKLKSRGAISQNIEICFVEREWPINKGNLNIYREFTDGQLRKFCALNHNCIVTKEKAREIFLRETFFNEYDFFRVESLLLLVNPLSSYEVSKLVEYAPEPDDLVSAANFITAISRENHINLTGKEWIEINRYINLHWNACVKEISAAERYVDYSIVIESLKRVLLIISQNQSNNSFQLLESAPLLSNLAAAGVFIKIITESEAFNGESPIFSDIIQYINRFRSACIKALATTNYNEEYLAILEAALNDVIWADGLPQFRDILMNRLELKNGGEFESRIQSFLLEQACTLFPEPSSVKIAEWLRNYIASCAGASDVMSDVNQLRLFNICSAVACQIALLNENDSAIKAAVEYANGRMVETMNSVQWNADKGLKKAALMQVRKEHRAVAALVNKIVTDVNSYFSKSEVAELYAAVLLTNEPSPEWIAMCETVRFTSSNLIIREGLARYFLSIANVAKAKPHVMAVMNFEPNSKLAAELKLLLARETAIKTMAEDGVDIENIDKMTGVEFEKVLINKLRGFGLKVMETPGSGDYGADIVIDDEDETRFIIQCKRFSSKVNLKAVQEVVAAMKHYSADYAIVATNSDFLKSAVELAKSNGIELWTGTEVMQVLSGDISLTVLAMASLPVVDCK